MRNGKPNGNEKVERNAVMLVDFHAGMSLKDLADKYGITHNAVYVIIERYVGTVREAQGGRSRRSRDGAADREAAGEDRALLARGVDDSGDGQASELQRGDGVQRPKGIGDAGTDTIVHSEEQRCVETGGAADSGAAGEDRAPLERGVDGKCDGRASGFQLGDCAGRSKGFEGGGADCLPPHS